MKARRFHEGDVVKFDFTVEHGGTGKTTGRRTGIGTIYDNEVTYQCWPPGYTVRVESSDSYKPGMYIAVASHNLGRVGGKS